jgi:hypothetical protein
MASAFGTSFGALDATLRFLQRLFDKGPALVSPLEFPNLVHNAAAGHASIALGTRGSSVTACQEELSADDALGALLAGIGAGEADQGVCAGGDLASLQLDEGYRRVRRVFDVPDAHASVVGALVVEAASACEERGGEPWARILASRGQGRHDGVPAAVRLALIDAFGEAAGGDAIDVWLRGGVSTEQLAREDEAAHLPALRGAETLTARRTLGNAGGAGAAVVAAGAALIASGGARTVLVTSVTCDGAAWATILAAPRGGSDQRPTGER